MGCCCRSWSWGVAVAGIAALAAGFVAVAGLDRAETQGPRVEGASFAQPEDQPEDEMSPEQMMEDMKKLSQPVEEHELFKDMEGEWDLAAKFYMAGPDAPPTESTGTATHRLVMGGRYLVQEVKMDEFMGDSFEGMGITGFDRAKGKYVNDWIDTWSTGIMSMTGEYDEDADTMDWKGSWEMATPDGGSVTMPAHHVVRHVDEDHMVMEFWETDQATGEEVKGGEITYTRRD